MMIMMMTPFAAFAMMMTPFDDCIDDDDSI